MEEAKWLEEKISFYGKERDIDQISSIVNSNLQDSMFLIPKSICEEIERMINSIWWGSDRYKLCYSIIILIYYILLMNRSR